MDVSFHGSARLRQAVAATQNRDAFRNWLERNSASAAPRWLSRERWLHDVADWSTGEGFRAARAASGISMTAPTFMAIMRVMADHADHADGRCVAVSRARIAAAVGCSPRTVTNAWRLLRLSGYGLEVQRGHGSEQTPSQGCRPSIYHLVSKRRPVVEFCYLPPKAGVGSSSPVDQFSLNGAPRRQKMPRRERQPHPIAVHKLAAQIARDWVGLKRCHTGQICNAIVNAGIDPGEWTYARLKRAVEDDMRATGAVWPDQVAYPQGFLYSRLRRVSSQ
ncbi:RepA-like replication initiator [Mycobacterium phage Gail]|uniref:RepA-like replication initiator n=1 Tax=Mycobacterium phage Gail TaxID=2743994 RepID=A0A7D5FUR4_9CAUD|nr:DNA binding protein [Mycobacterium phage Gail]QLF84601.1 RepA-like replication initiator [Mycobacterium phage Gail]